MSIDATLKQLAEEIHDAHAQFANGIRDNRDGWRDSNAQHLVTQLSLSAFRQEVVDGFARLHRRLDAMGVPNG